MSMSKVMRAGVASMMVFAAGTAPGQEYPVKPIRIITAGVGGGNDFAARQIAQGISGPLGQQIVVVNQSVGVIPGETVARSAPDGYTLLINTGGLWTSPFFAKTSYDPVRDFAPISLVTRSPNILVVHPSLPVKTVRELIALAKAHPGELNFSAGSIGGSSHLSAELFKSMAGVNIVRIHYKSAGSEIAELIGGHVQMSFGSTGSVMSHVKSGRLRGLAVTTPKPTDLVPGLPTVAAAGLPGYESGQIVGFFAPAKTPEAAIRRLNQETVRFLNAPATKQVFFQAGVEPVGNSPEELAATIKSEMTRLGKIIQEAGLKGE